MTSRLPSHTAESSHWKQGQRRMFLLLVVLCIGACSAALLSQQPAIDSLDRWALPALSATLLLLQVLIALNRIPLGTAFSAAFFAASIYVLLALNHQFSVMPRTSGTLMENTYWFAVLYAAAFVTFPNRRATEVAVGILGIAAVICLWHLHFTVPDATRGKLTGSTIQFLLMGAVITVMQATLGLQRAQLIATRNAAFRDGLTGLANRRSAEERLDTLTRAEASYTLVLFDLDHFKQVNDRHGHATGDLVLRGVAEVARTHLPAGGLAARWGGEEFLLILPPLGDQEVRRTLNNLRNELRQQQHGAVIGLTASFGVATARPGEHPDDVVSRADAAMYVAKQQGRNDIRVSDSGFPRLPTPDGA